MSTLGQRKCYRQHYEEHHKLFNIWRNLNMNDKRISRSFSFPPFPDDLRGLTCGAKTRAGTACKQKAIFINGRCKFHGGLSTGPKTEAGKKRSAENGKCTKIK